MDARFQKVAEEEEEAVKDSKQRRLKRKKTTQKPELLLKPDRGKGSRMGLKALLPIGQESPQER